MRNKISVFMFNNVQFSVDFFLNYELLGESFADTAGK